MGFDIKIWKTEIQNRLYGWKEKMQSAGVNSVYAFIATTSVWPVFEAAQKGDWAALTALGGMVGGVGSNLLANMIQGWKNEADAARQIESAVDDDDDGNLRAELDAVLQQLDVINQAYAAVAREEREWFVRELSNELEILGNIDRFQAQLAGSGAIAMGEGAIAAGEKGLAIKGDVHGDVIMHGAQKTERKEVEKDDEAESLRSYLRVLFTANYHLPLRGRDIGASDPTNCSRRMNLASVYIDLKTDKAKEKERVEEVQQLTLFDWEPPLLSLLEAVAENRHVVILGNPGSGKSTFLNHLTLCLAGHVVEPAGKWLGHLPDWPSAETGLVPITVTLRDFDRWLSVVPKKAEPVHILGFIKSRMGDKGLEASFEPLQKALDKGRAIILLDGLDEIADPHRLIFVRDAVEAFASRYRLCRIVITCRIQSYRELVREISNFSVFNISPFDQDMIKRFITAWYDELDKIVKLPGDPKAMAYKLVLTVQQRPDLRGLASNPLLLTVMALVNTHLGRLPDTRAVLYEKAVEILMWRWDQLKSPGEETAPRLQELLCMVNRTDVDLKGILGRMAFEAQQGIGSAEAEKYADIKEWELLQSVATLHPDKNLEWANQVVLAIRFRAGLLVERLPGVYSFPHRTFQEYLAGAHLGNRDDFPSLAVQLARQGALWREVILLAVGRLVFVNGDTSKPLALISELAPGRKSTAKTARALLLLAGEVLIEIGPNRCQDTMLGKDLLARVVSRLKADMRLVKANPIERVEAGRVLAKLGDPRKGVGLDWGGLPDIDWVKIEKGSFTMGSDKKKDPKACDDEERQRQYTIPYDYGISRYPITNAQFRAFVDAKGYLFEKYWAAVISAGYWDEKGFGREDDKSKRLGPYEFGEPFSLANHPVVGVTWYEALAFCAWLTERLHEAGRLDKGRIITLPSEPEWEKAARGEDGSIYPWGNDPDPNRANYDKTGINSTSAVGCFPAGKSPYKVEEMSGNVWEWTRSLWGKDWQKPDYGYPYQHGDGREDQEAPADMLRVLRGGSFGHDQGVRCACRYWNFPYGWGWSLGFRVVSPPILKTLDSDPSGL